MRRTVLAIGLGMVLAASPARAQQYQLALRREVDRAARSLKDSGFSPEGPLVYGTLNANARDTRPLALVAGGRYVVVGVCDQDCTGLALALVDPSGAASGTAGGGAARPTLEVSAAATGAWRLGVEMRACRQSPCYWGVQLFKK